MNSMTGYAYKEVVADGTQISVEIKSVNSRFLDLSVNIPPFLNQLENRIRTLVSEKVSRGKVDVTIRVHDANSSAVVTADTKAAVEYRDAIASVAEALGQKAEAIPLSLIISQQGVLNVEYNYDAESYWKKIEPVFSEVYNSFIGDRVREGKNLQKDLTEKLDKLDKCALFFKECQPKMEILFKQQITQKFNELLGEHADENRIMQETAALLVKYTINEEIVRLLSHLDALRKEFVEDEVPGKRIDFICQEINREINTIGSKNQFTEVGAMVVNAKDALENIREQAKNVE